MKSEKNVKSPIFDFDRNSCSVHDAILWPNIWAQHNIYQLNVCLWHQTKWLHNINALLLSSVHNGLILYGLLSRTLHFVVSVTLQRIWHFKILCHFPKYLCFNIISAIVICKFNTQTNISWHRLCINSILIMCLNKMLNVSWAWLPSWPKLL